MAALNYVQPFDGLSNGTLNGQDSWTQSSGSTSFSVEDTVVLDGTKSLINITALNGDNDYRRALDSCDSGDFFAAWRVEDAGGNKRLIFGNSPFTSSYVIVGFPGSNAAGFWGDAFVLFDSSFAAQTVESTFATGTKFYFNVQFDDVNQPNKARARVWRSGTGWGTWTSWITVPAYTAVTGMRIDCGGGDGTGACTMYLDTFQETDPVPSIITKDVSDTTMTTDAIARATSRTISDATANTDSVVTVKVLSQTVSETLALTDSVLRTAGKSILETLALTDSVIRGSSRVILDALAMAAADSVIVTKVAVKTITDSLAMAAFDTVITATVFARTILDALGMSDSVTIRSLWQPRTKPTSSWTPRSKT